METTYKTFTSSRGVEINLKPISQFKIDSWKASKIELPKPTYEAEVAGGEKLLVPLDEEIARNKGRQDEWFAYQKEQSRLDAEFTKRLADMAFWYGVEIEVPGADSEWQKVSDHLGLKIPDDPIERKLRFIYEEVLGTPDDIKNLLVEILAVSQVDEEVVAKLRNSFQPGVQRKADSRVRKK